jgi:hypothetical protein
MGVAAFTRKLEKRFLNQLDPRDIPKDVDPADGDAVRAWFAEAFGYWFLEHRDELLGREWVRRGWAESVLRATESGSLREAFRVRPECAEKIDAWLQDELD